MYWFKKKMVPGNIFLILVYQEESWEMEVVDETRRVPRAREGILVLMNWTVCSHRHPWTLTQWTESQQPKREMWREKLGLHRSLQKQVGATGWV